MDKGCPTNKSGGAQNADAQRKKKAATSAKGRHNQKRGSSDSNATAKHAKPMKNLENMVF